MRTKLLKTQLATSFGADFEENTWTFLMPEVYQVAAGDFYIIDKPVYDKLISACNSALDWLQRSDAGRAVPQVNGQPGEWANVMLEALGTFENVNSNATGESLTNQTNDK